ncbi:MAG: NDP-sugar synthase [Bacteroidales bacterium]
MKPTLLVLAAGMGSRYGGLKQIDKLGPSGETIIDYSIYDAIQAGFGRVVMVIRKSIEADFKEVFLNKYKGKIDISYVLQEVEYVPEGLTYTPERVKPWGTAHAVLMAADAIKEPFAVINGDDFYGADAFRTMGKFLSQITNMEARTYSMVGYPLANTLSEYGTVARGVCEVEGSGFLTGVVERTSISRIDGVIQYKDEAGSLHPVPEASAVSMNFWGFTPSFFGYLRSMFADFVKENGMNPKSEFFIPLVANKLVKSEEATIKVLNTQAEWFGVTYKEDRPWVVARFETLAKEGIYPSPLFA